MSETGPQGQPDDVLLDLLVKQVTEGLSPAEQRALDTLDSATAGGYARDLERAAAAVSLASVRLEPLPAALRADLETQGALFVKAPAASKTVAAGSAVAADNAVGSDSAVAAGNNAVGSESGVVAGNDAVAPESGVAAGNVLSFKAARSAGGGARAASNSGTLGWFAAAACLVLALVGWLRSPPVAEPPVATVQVAVPPAVVQPEVKVAPPTPAEERAAMLARADSQKATLGATKDAAAAGVSGDVVWDPATQKGFLHFVGLKSNDPRVSQYQAWIFDGSRDKRYPVDGGVFDVPADQPEIVIPIHAALDVRMAKAFAVTVEKPGGAVVSGLAHVVALGNAS